MNLKDTCAAEGITIAEGKEKYGLSHWNAKVPESCDEIAEIPKDPVEELVSAVVETAVKPIETKSKEDGVSMQDKINSCNGVGTKSQYWSELNG